MDYLRINALDVTVVLACAQGAPLSITYWGALLPAGVAGTELEHLSLRQGMHGVADSSLPLSLAMEPGLGHPMLQCFAAHREGNDWGSLFEV